MNFKSRKERAAVWFANCKEPQKPEANRRICFPSKVFSGSTAGIQTTLSGSNCDGPPSN